MNNRAYALDALRGYAIITMVLSATIVTQVLPGWMSHAQTPPPDHIFNPSLPGITWVDLVFPFFLFAMGAAFPFSKPARQHLAFPGGRWPPPGGRMRSCLLYTSDAADE